jgi:LacI family transcriptional regulator
MNRRARPRNSPTIPDVAALAGVSNATAARALGGYGAVSPAVRDKVAEAAAKLGYRPNSLARSMITGETHTIGLVVADIENPFFARAARGIGDVAHAAGYEVLLANSDEDPATERAAVRTLYEKRVDGLIVAPTSTDDGPHLSELPARGVPVVLIDRIVPGIDADAVVVDNDRAARRAVDHLVGLGHRRIALLTSVGLIHTNQMRLAGYLEGLRGAGIEPDDTLVRMSEYHREAAVNEMHSALSLPDPPTAVFTTDNLMSLGAFEGAQRAGRAVPDELSIVGFDDLEWTTIVRPPLTVVAQPTYELGATAARRLIARMEGDESPPTTFTLDTTFVIRGSTGPAPGSSASSPKASANRRTKRTARNALAEPPVG